MHIFEATESMHLIAEVSNRSIILFKIFGDDAHTVQSIFYGSRWKMKLQFQILLVNVERFPTKV